MAEKFPKSGLPIRKSSEFLPQTFRSDQNDKFLSGVLDPLVQPGVLDKTVGYIGRRYGKTYKGESVYLDTDQTLRSKYQLEPGIVVQDDNRNAEKFYDYLDLKNILNFFGNENERDDKIVDQEHYSWNPPIDWDKFINFREYYWVPAGPPSVAVYGQNSAVNSTYKVKTGTLNTWVFTPDGFTNNPTITLYRGQTYRFVVNSPKEGFVIRTNYDTGSLSYDPNRDYFPGDLAIFGGKLWRAKVNVLSLDGSSIDENSQDWELLDSSASNESLIYNNGITNNGVKNGTLTFEVPLDSPDVLFYQSDVEPNRLGRFIIADIESNTAIDVEKEIIGKVQYESANGVKFTNGLIVEFRGEVQSEVYQTGTWLVEGVGESIQLKNFADLVPPIISASVPEILFDNEGFDSQPFDDATQYPGTKDYITIKRTSKDNNPWSRYNRWFHRSVLEYSYTSRGLDFDGLESSRAKRPIIEFLPNIKLHNHGITSKTTVDYVDTFTQDVLSTIEGSTGYSVDGEFLFEGARVLVTADTDNLTNNKIYSVKFILHNGRRQITLVETSDTESIINECVLVRRGKENAGKMYHFNGTDWIKSQEKISVNQAPLFDAFDEQLVSAGDADKYPVSTFVGNKIFSYKQGNGVVDTELGFSLSYLNIDNVGDIQFNYDWDYSKFSYTLDQTQYSKNINTCYFLINGNYENGWIKTDNEFLHPIVESLKISQSTSSVVFDLVDWAKLPDEHYINFYVNGEKINDTYTRVGNTFTFARQFSVNDIVTIKLVAEITPDQGYYEFPVGIEKNPLNETLQNFTLGQAIDHVKTGLEFNLEFQGSIPGQSNLRDLEGYRQHTKRLMKHAGLAPTALALLCDKEVNIIKSLQFAKKSYTIFKDNFIKKASEIEYEEDVSLFVDNIIAELSRTKDIDSYFADSDMIGTGASNTLTYQVEDPGIKTFTLTEKFNLSELSRRAVYVYLNGVQLLHGADYTFDSAFAFVNITTNLNVNDVVTIREYISTAFSHIPPTPSSMGLYKKYTPMMYLDDTFREPRTVIRGHDGSITLAYEDFRDDLLIELEKRIYNNIKNVYDEDVFDIDSILGGYYGNALFDKEETDQIVIQEFLKWVANTNLQYTENEYFIENESFTYTYSNMLDPTNSSNLPGWWRGVYRWFYDTDKPHIFPWECLGFSEKPTWWEDEYGPAPYTSGNLILWEDIRDGIIRQGDRAGRYARYARTSILNHLPVDADGNLLNPLTSGLAQNYVLYNNKGPFKLGDVSPVESAWRSSSEYPFAIMIALSLLRPFDFIISNFNRDKTQRNIIDQLVDKTTNTFLNLLNVTLPVPGETQTVGLANYISSYIKSQGREISTGQSMLSNINVKLTTRLSGFVDKDQQKYLLDSKNPSSTSSSVFVPSENYDVIFNVSSPIASISYSGIIFQKTDRGWILTGYDNINPFFRYYKVFPNQKDPVISVGGVSETYVTWAEQQRYNNGAIVLYRNDFYRATRTIDPGDNFQSQYFQKLAKLPVRDAVTALRRRNFNKFEVFKLSYGTVLNTIQEVVDFIIGYQEYLQDQGFVFDRYDTSTQVVQDWITSAKEFMFWTKQNWALGSLLTVSPGAQSVKIVRPIGVVDNLLDGFYEYGVLKADGQTLPAENIDGKREFQTFTLSTTNTTEGIYYCRLNYVLKEHVTVFDKKTVFNDIIYDTTTGYRQERIKSQGFRTVDWDGDYTSPGFLFDNVDIKTWQPFVDYKLGDIVAYKSLNYTALLNHTSGENFSNIYWNRLDLEPSKQLIPNYDYRVDQFEDYFDVESDGLGDSQRELARHTLGYQSREYLNSLTDDEVTQFRLYQGFIREKGTNNSITKLFDKISRNGESSIVLKEEWAFKVGEFGGTDQTDNYELALSTDKFKINPQPIIVYDTTPPANNLDRYYRVSSTDFNFAPLPYSKNINPLSLNAQPFLTAGYVKLGQTEFTVKTRDDILTLNIDDVNDNDHVWVTFDKNSWTVMRFNYILDLQITSINVNQKTVTISFNRRHNLQVGDIIGLNSIDVLKGFHKIDSVGQATEDGSTGRTDFSINITVDPSPGKIDFIGSSILFPCLLTEVRYENFAALDEESVALLKSGSKLFVDKNNTDHWEVLEKNKQYTPKQITSFGIAEPRTLGTKVLYDINYKSVISSMPYNTAVGVYLDTDQGLVAKQILEPSTLVYSSVSNRYGKELALSPDSAFLAVGTPEANQVRTYYRGPFQPTESYYPNDIVLYQGKLYRCTKTTFGDGSTIDINTEDWELTKNINVLETESGYVGSESNQGMVSIYKYEFGQWVYSSSFTSPRPVSNEYFGSKITISKNGTTYYMAVSAPGALNYKGKVYLYRYSNNQWILDADDNYKGVYDSGTEFNSIDFEIGQAYIINYLGDTDWNRVANTTAVSYSVGDRVVSYVQGSPGTGTAITDPFYPSGSIVYFDKKLWQAQTDVRPAREDGSTLDANTNDWVQLDEVVTGSSLPISISLEDDGSTLAGGLITDNQVAELVKEGDKFGSSMTMSSDGSVLVVGAPYADGQYFSNYKGIWNPYSEYIEGDVVTYQGGYHKLQDRRYQTAPNFSIGFTYTIVDLGTTDWNKIAGTTGISYSVGDSIIANPLTITDTGFTGTGIAWETSDSTIVSYNEYPDAGYPWENVGDSSAMALGKVYIYRKNSVGVYKLDQTITADNLLTLNDTGETESISSGDLFGSVVKVDPTGQLLLISSPMADRNFQNQGSVYVFNYESDSSAQEFRLKQKLQNYSQYPNEYFGGSLCLSENRTTIVVGANNSPYQYATKFDTTTTSFDKGATTFKDYSGFAGAVYVYEKKGNRYFLAEKLDDQLSLGESFGASIDCNINNVVVGSPLYVAPAPHGPGLAFEGTATGMVRVFKKSENSNSLEIISTETPTVDIDKIKRISLYNSNSDTKIQDIEVVDPAKMKILASSEREITYKTPYDPAVYSVGNDSVIVDSSSSWFSKNVGKLWWNLSTVKFIDYAQGDISYRLGNWGALAEGASVDVYEWVESKLLPSEWSQLADTNEGLAAGISGQPLYPDDSVFAIKELYNTLSGELNETLYYYWVKGKTTIPNIVGRKQSSASVSAEITNPFSVGNTFVALADSDKIFFYNYNNIVATDETVLNIEYYNNDSQIKNSIHNEYALISEDIADSIPPSRLENKMIDSLIGYDSQGNRVPDDKLPIKQRYGISYRPRQSMFVDRKSILKIVIENINTVLKQEPFATSINYENLNLVDNAPAEILKLYDESVDSTVDLETVGTTRVRVATLSTNILDGKIDSIDIVEPGFGYRVAPEVEFEGDGINAKAFTSIDNQGRISSVTINNGGKNYSYAIAKVRPFSVLVTSDTTLNGAWSIYAWDSDRKVFFRSRSQAYDTTKYWNYADWWKAGYGITTRVVKELVSTVEEEVNTFEIGDKIRIREYGSGGWAVFEKINSTGQTFLDRYELVGRESGTIQLSSNLYDTATNATGFDNLDSFDIGNYDKEVSNELRNIFKAIKENIFIGSYAVEWNRLFFSCVRYVFDEQTYVDWAFKTSFLNAIHNVGDFKTTVNYKADSLDQYLEYINEVKPYRTTIREYLSRYNNSETSNTAVTDFDLPPGYSVSEGKIVPIGLSSFEIDQYPWKYWLDNYGFILKEIRVSKGGSGYTSPPRVVIEGGGGSGATAQAYISSGSVVGIKVTNPGSGYTGIPTISLVGGNGSSTDIAKAVPILAESKARSFAMTMKFDRINKTGYYQNFNFTQSFTASGSSSVFELTYAPTRDKNKITLYKNSQVVLNNEYSISLYRTSTDDFQILKGKIIFQQNPSLGDVITVTYEKNDELLDSVNRIDKYYSPVSGMKGKELSQLMTGIDFGGVLVQGTTFDVTGGWDALPWFTDSWDSVEAASDYYIVVDGSTTFVTLPYVPASGQQINIYLKRAGEGTLPTVDDLQYSDYVKEPKIVRIDDPYFVPNSDSSLVTNPNAVMPTFVGDGSTSNIEIGKYIRVNDGDTLIFRPVQSDGSVTITDTNILDTQISGGTLSSMSGAYATATGMTVDEIVISGDKFISPDQVPAPEENIPGQVLDNVSIKVFSSVSTGGASLLSKVIKADGSSLVYDIGQDVIENKSVTVFVDGIAKTQGDASNQYTVNIKNKTIIFNTAPVENANIEVLSVGIGGVEILDYQEFIADGETAFYLTNASYNQTSSVFVSLDGIQVDVGFIDSTGVVDSIGRTLIEFPYVPSINSVIKIVCLAASTDVDSSLQALIRVNQQDIIHDGSTRSYDLDNFVQLTRSSAVSSMVVEVNDTKLKGVDSIYAEYDGTNNQFLLGEDPFEGAGAILTRNIDVYVNNDPLIPITDYTYNGTTKELEIIKSLEIGDKIIITNNLRSQYSVENNNIVIDNSVSLTAGDTISVTWFSEYPSMGIFSDVKTGGKVVYDLPFKPLGVSYTWVYVNGIRQKKDIDYSLSLPRGVLYLHTSTTSSDTITITSFGSGIYKQPSGFEISKDMLNNYRFNRISIDKNITLAKALNYYDTSIEVTNGANLPDPIASRNIAGTILINGEKIEYLSKQGNTLGTLRRGVQGTAIKEIHAAGSYVVDVSISEALPYKETQDRLDFVSDGSSLIIGPLDFVPAQSTDANWYSQSIPAEFGRSDTIEVFAGGRRLRKTPIDVFDEQLGATSPAGDRRLEAEFSVDGVNPSIRLTQALPAGTRISIIKKTGQSWYDRGETTATSGVTLLDNESSISKFIAARTTRLPE